MNQFYLFKVTNMERSDFQVTIGKYTQKQIPKLCNY